MADGNEEIILKGRYRLSRRLGEGAMAATFLADDLKQGRPVVVKMLYPSRLTTFKDFDLFTREAEALSRIDHPRVPRFVDNFIGEEGGEKVFCLVQEFAPGRTLAVHLQEGRRVEEAECIALALKVLEVLSHLYDLDPPIVHRDIKPENIILGEAGEPSLVDFGAVREAVRQTIPSGTTIIGTFGFMPPEQLMGEAVPASDLFALGVTMLCSLTRRPAHELSQDGFTVNFDTLNLNISPGLKQVLRGMTAIVPDDRYTRPQLVQEDLERLQKGRPPRHAQALKRESAKRRKGKARAIRRRLSEGQFWAYFFLALIFGSVVFGLFYLAVSQSVRALDDLRIYLAVSMVGLLGVVIVAVKRYLVEGWFPPPRYKSAEAQVESIYQMRDKDNNELINNYQVNYIYPAEGEAVNRGEVYGSREIIKGRYELGSRFPVYYDQDNPKSHEFVVSKLERSD